MKPVTRKSITIRILLSIIWLALFIMLLQRDYFLKTLEIKEAAALSRAEKTNYQGIYFRNKKIGYVENQFLPDDEKINIRQTAFLKLNISGQEHPFNLDLDALVTGQNRLERFTFRFSSPFYQMQAAGHVKGNTVSFTLDTGSSNISENISLTAPPLIATSRRTYLLDQELITGQKIKIPWFDPVSLTGKTSTIEYRGKEQVLINDRVFNLHRFTEFFSGTRVNSWLDDEGNVIKEESPAGFVFIREPEFKAKKLDENSSELLSAVSVKIIGKMVNPGNRAQLRYRLTLPDHHHFILDSGRQQFDGSILTVNREVIPRSRETKTSCSDTESTILPSSYIQSDSPQIQKTSKEIVGSTESAEKKVQAIGNWVYKSLEKRPVIGIPDALTTLHNRKGDCNEHAFLFAALARSAGIPTKIAAGVVYHKNAFYYHAWNEVCIEGRWISIDTTTMQFPTDVSHLKFVEGGLQEQMEIGSLLGTLQIEPLP